MVAAIVDLQKVPSPQEAWDKLTPIQQFLVSIVGIPHCIGKYKLPGWTGSLGFYIFKCGNCGELRIDYSHGWDGYLSCDPCLESFFSR